LLQESGDQVHRPTASHCAEASQPRAAPHTFAAPGQRRRAWVARPGAGDAVHAPGADSLPGRRRA